jgi:hypothetical protein
MRGQRLRGGLKAAASVTASSATPGCALPAVDSTINSEAAGSNDYPFCRFQLNDALAQTDPRA